MSAYRSRYAESSRVQPGVNAFGKKATMTGPSFTISDSVYALPVVSFAVKSGATSPAWGVAPLKKPATIRGMSMGLDLMGPPSPAQVPEAG